MPSRETLRAGLLGALWLAYLIYAYGLGAYSEILPHPVCPFLWLTGIPCPLCGLTHACTYLMHGHVALALGTNPLCPLALLPWPMYAAIYSYRKALMGSTCVAGHGGKKPAAIATAAITSVAVINQIGSVGSMP